MTTYVGTSTSTANGIEGNTSTGNRAGVYGHATGSANGVYADSGTGYALEAWNGSTTNATVYANNQSGGCAVQGVGSGTVIAAANSAIYGTNSGNSGVAIWGESTGTGGYGVYATAVGGTAVYASSSSGGNGVFGNTGGGTGISGATAGVWGYSGGTQGAGVYGSTASGCGVYGTASSTGISINESGVTGNNSGAGAGVYGNSSTGPGVVGESGGGTGTVAISGQSTGGGGTGVKGTSSGAGSVGVYGGGGAGVVGDSTVDGGAGVEAISTGNNAYALFAKSSGVTSSWAGYFVGNINVTMAITAGTKDFRIDHPLDPANKWLRHSCVESPERMTVYNGVATTDKNGDAEIQMPSYFDALNTDFRYQLTAIGAPAPNLHIKVELRNGRFVIGGGSPAQRISWQVTGIRQDACAKGNPLIVEEDKLPDEKGLYAHPELHGQPKEKGISWALEQRLPVRAATPPAP